MILYIIGIIGGGIAICILNLIFCNGTYNYTTLNIILGSFLAVFFEIAIDAVCATVTRKCLPEKYFDHTVAFHNASKKECKFYEKLGIKFWKDYVLELGMFTNFSKKEIADPHSVEYIDRFILENNYGAVLHIISCFAGFLLIPFWPGRLKLTVILPGAIINFILNIMPFMILRYNTDRLQRVRKVLEGKAARAKKLEAEKSE